MSLIILDYKYKKRKTNKEYLSTKADGLILNSLEFSCFNDGAFPLKELLKEIDKVHEKGKICIVNMDRIIEENDIDFLIFYLDNIKNRCDYLIYSDMAIYSYLKKDYFNKLIYDPKTLVASKEEVNTIKVHSFLSNELSEKEIKFILDNCQNTQNISFEVFGYHQIMYSKRPLLNLYNVFIEKEVLKSNKLYDLKEELREDLYRIIESDNGTYIYTPYVYIMFKELKEFSSRFKFIRLNSTFIDDDIMFKVCDIYKEYLSNYSDNLKEEIDKLPLRFNRGFLDKESFLLKGDNEDA